ncbi:MAG: DNA repair protein RecO [Flavobacteriia bacterium]|nr:MAG: DNA repair protein RecO [Flavobacteriia bacterium]
MYQPTKIIVLNSLKYGDNGLIVKAYSRDFGLVSYFIKSLSKGKKGKFKKAFFQPLSQLNIVARHSNKGQLNYIKELDVAYHYQELYTDIVKQSIGLFLAELLVNTLEEHQADDYLYDFLDKRFRQLDMIEKPANFHLAFIKDYIMHLGVFPKMENPQPYFDLLEGHYTSVPAGPLWIEGQALQYFELIMTRTFEAVLALPMNKDDRHHSLESLLNYLDTHLAKYKPPKSLDILRAIF